MRKGVVAIVALIVLVGAVAPATAGKKAIKKTYRVDAPVPYPVTSSVNEIGCLEGEEGVNKGTETFKAPFDGYLSVELSDFQGDWDLHVTGSDGRPIMSSTSGQPVEPQIEVVDLVLTKRQEVGIAACNWAGGSSAQVSYTFTRI